MEGRKGRPEGKEYNLFLLEVEPDGR